MASTPQRVRSPGAPMILPGNATRVMLTDGRVEVYAADDELLEMDQLADTPQLVVAPDLARDWTQQAGRVSLQVSLDLLQGSATAARRTQARMGQTFGAHLSMLVLTFLVGLLGFVAALIKGMGADTAADAATTAVFGGLSATSFVAFFIANPTRQVSDAGPRSAWLLALLNTYWTKLAYLQDPSTIVEKLQQAQQDLDDGFVRFLAQTSPRAADPEDGGQDERSAPSTRQHARTAGPRGKQPTNGQHEPADSGAR